MDIRFPRSARPALTACLLLAIAAGSAAGASSAAPSTPDGRWTIMVATAIATPTTAPADESAQSAVDPEALPPPLLLDDAIEPLKPRRPRTEAEEDQLEALARFSAARMFQHQGETAAALKQYQRALRYDPESGTVAQMLVSLAIQLNRSEEAARAALLATKLEGIDPMQLRQLGGLLRSNGDWQGAVRMYEKALAARKEGESTAVDVVLQMELGGLYHVVEEHEKAAASFDLVLDALEHPEKYGLNNAIRKLVLGEGNSAYELIGECFLLAGRFDKAIAVFETFHQATPDPGRLAYNLARVDARRDKPKEAISHLQTSFDRHLEGAGIAPYQLLQTVLEDLGREDELVDRLEKLHADDPQNVPLAYFLAGQYLDAGQADQAESLYRQLAKESPTITGYRSLVEIYRNSDRPGELLDVLAEASSKVSSLDALDADDRPISDDPALVDALLVTARKRHQADPEAFGSGPRRAAAMLALEAGRPDTAGEFYELAIEADPDREVELLQVWGLGLLFQDDYTRSVKIFRRALDQQLPAEEQAAFLFYLAGALEMDGQTDKALAAANKAVQSDEDSPGFQSRLGWVLFHADRLDEAYQAYRDLIDRFDSRYGQQEIRQVVRESRLALSNLCVLQEKRPEAVELLEQVLDEFPTDISALNDLGYLWAEEGEHLERAERMIRQAVEAAPENAAYRDSLGWVLYRLGRPQQAVVELEQAAQAEPDPVILDHLGDVYLALDKHDQAKQAWQRAVKRFQENKKDHEAAKVQEKLDQGR